MKKEDAVLEHNLTNEQFYNNYIKDNCVFNNLNEEAHQFLKEHAGEVYSLALAKFDDAWRAVEAAARQVLKSNGMDGETW